MPTASQERKGLYKVTFEDPTHEPWEKCPRCGRPVAAEDARCCYYCRKDRRFGGSKLDVAHGAGYHDDPRPINLASGTPYVGPLSDDELAFLRSLEDGSAANSLSYPAEWVVKVERAEVK